jgi:hypothetical protein
MLPTADNYTKVQRILESWRIARSYLRDASLELDHWLITKNEPDALEQLTRLGQAIKLCEIDNDLIAFYGFLIDMVSPLLHVLVTAPVLGLFGPCRPLFDRSGRPPWLATMPGL